jgi:hypothetical protein
MISRAGFGSSLDPSAAAAISCGHSKPSGHSAQPCVMHYLSCGCRPLRDISLARERHTRGLMKLSHRALFPSLVAAMLAAAMFGGPALAAPPAQPAIRPDASAAVAAMGNALQAPAYSVQVRTIRESDQNGDWIHVFHASKLTVRRPDRLLYIRTGDNGQSELIYDGKTLVVALDGGKKYASIQVPGTIEGMVRDAVGKLGVDLPIADLLTEDPAKAFMSGITAGHEVDTVMIDGVACRHLLFSQPGIELELWVEKNDRAVPRRLIITYRSLPGDPEFMAEFSNWNFDVHPSDADFVFQPPAGAVKMRLRPAHAPGGK